MVKILERNDIFGRIGQGLGQGAGEAFKETAKRGQLARGLQNIQKSLGQNKNPLDIYSQLLSIPGMDTQQAQMLFPLIRNAALQSQSPQNIAQQTTQNIPEQTQFGTFQPTQNATGIRRPTTQINIPSSRISDEATPQTAQSPTLNVQGTNATLTEPRLLSPQETLSIASELQRTNPLLYPSIEDAIPEAQRRAQFEKERHSVAVEREARQKAVRDDVREQTRLRTDKLIQAAGADKFEQVPAEIDENILDDVMRNIANGEDKDTAISEGARKQLSFAKTRLNLKNNSSLNSAKTWLSNLDSIAKEYDKVGGREILKNDLVTFFGLSPPAAASLIYKLNPSLKKSIDEIKRTPEGPTKEDVANFVDRVSKSLKDGDSIQSIQHELRTGINDPEIFMQGLQDAYNNGELKLKNERQERELSSLDFTGISIKDAWFIIKGIIKGY